MNGRTLTADEDLERASEAFGALTGCAMPLEYLRRGIVHGWYVGGELAAGFACITEPPFRVLSVLREDQLDGYLKQCLRRGQVCELHGLFIRPELKSGLDVFTFAKAVLLAFLETGMDCALFGYDKAHQNLTALYQRPLLSPVKLLEGPVVPPDGSAAADDVFLGYLRADHIARSLRRRGRREGNSGPIHVPWCASGHAEHGFTENVASH